MHEAASSARQVLEFLVAAGIETPLEEHPVDRFALSVPPPPKAEPASEAAERPSRMAGTGAAPAPLAPDAAIMEARRLASSAPDLETLRNLLDAFEGCALKSTASRLVFADGTPGAPIMIVGEAPGREEDEIGRPFVGRAGQLLDKMLAAIGLNREHVYIANTVPWRPPGNRTPTPQEIAICMPFITRQIALSAPKILITMGAPATQTLLGQKEGILRLRGRWFEYEMKGEKIPALATLHPAYLLRQPSQKALAWRDLRAVQAKLRGLG